MYFLNTFTVLAKPSYSSFASTSVNEEPEAVTTPRILSTAYIGKVWVAKSIWSLSELRDSQIVSKIMQIRLIRRAANILLQSPAAKKLKNPTTKYLLIVDLCGDNSHFSSSMNKSKQVNQNLILVPVHVGQFCSLLLLGFFPQSFNRLFCHRNRQFEHLCPSHRQHWAINNSSTTVYSEGRWMNELF